MNPRMNSDQPGWRRFLIGASLALLALLSAGCFLTTPRSDPTRFYVLSTQLAGGEPAAKGPAIHLRPVELASYIKSKPMIVRRDGNEIEFREYARWGEPLELGIGRVLREDLLARGAAGAVLAGGLRAVDVEYDYVLTVRVLACEGGAGGAVFFHAAWTLSTASVTPRVVAQGEYRPTGLRWDGKSEATLAARLSEAVAGLAAEIAAAMTKR
jgi:uncharacterized lipoprotein YmbA